MTITHRGETWRLHVDPEDLWFNRSASRSGDDRDGVWGGSATARSDAGVELTVNFGSYNTMTDCVRRGITWSWRSVDQRPFGAGMDITALDRPIE